MAFPTTQQELFVRKDLCEARAKPCSVFKFSDNLSTLSQMYLPHMRLWVRLTFGQMLGQVDLWSDVPPVKTSCGQV